MSIVLSCYTDRLVILKAAAWNALSEDELEEILSCESEPMLRCYLNGVFRAAGRLWKYFIRVQARDVFQKEFFHPATVNPKLQSHLGMTIGQRIFDKYDSIHTLHIQHIYHILHISAY